MGRREQRAELEATWTVYTPAKSGAPITKADRDNAVTPEEHERQRDDAFRKSFGRGLRGLAARQRVRG